MRGKIDGQSFALECILCFHLCYFAADFCKKSIAHGAGDSRRYKGKRCVHANETAAFSTHKVRFVIENDQRWNTINFEFLGEFFFEFTVIKWQSEPVAVIFTEISPH